MTTYPKYTINIHDTPANTAPCDAVVPVRYTIRDVLRTTHVNPETAKLLRLAKEAGRIEAQTAIIEALGLTA